MKQLLFSDLALAQDSTKTKRLENNPKEKYSLIIAPETYRDKKILTDFDEGIKNAFLLNIASIYDSQKNEGYSPENIHILYADGKIDTSEQYNRPQIEELTQEKYLLGQIIPATKYNIEKTIDSLANKIDSNDEFTLTIMGHGEKDFLETYIKIPNYKNTIFQPEKITTSDLEKYSEKIKAEQETYIIDACYSGEFAQGLAKENQQVFTSSTKNSPSIISRIDSFSRYLIYAKTDPEADLNNDGIINWEEAFQKAEQERKIILKKHEKSGHTLFGKYPLEGFYGQKYNLRE